MKTLILYASVITHAPPLLQTFMLSSCNNENFLTLPENLVMSFVLSSQSTEPIYLRSIYYLAYIKEMKYVLCEV